MNGPVETVSSRPDCCVIVTGGAGYIGSTVCQVLSDNGYLPITIDNLSSGHDWAVQWGPLYKRCATRDISDIVGSLSPAAIFHLAGVSNVPDSWADPVRTMRENVQSTRRLADIAPVILASSCSVYGGGSGPLSEDMELNPCSPYAESKALAEEYATVSLRLFNAVGSGVIGECHKPETHLIPLALSGAVSIYGDGSQVRDYVDVRDIARAFILSIGRKGIYNVGSGKGRTVLDVVRSVSRTTGKPIDITYKDQRKGDVSSLIADTRKAEAELGFKSRISFADSITSASRWHNTHARKEHGNHCTIHITGD